MGRDAFYQELATLKNAKFHCITNTHWNMNKHKRRQSAHPLLPTYNYTRNILVLLQMSNAI